MKLSFLFILTLLSSSVQALSQNTNPAKNASQKKTAQCEVTLAGKAGDIELTKTEILITGSKLKLSRCIDSTKIISFQMLLTDKNGITHQIISKCNLFTAEMKDDISQMPNNGHIIIENVTIKPLHSDSYIIPGINIELTGK